MDPHQGTGEGVRRALEDAFHLRPFWTGLIMTAALMSTFEVAYTRDGTLVNYHVTATTALLIALMWLPNMIRTVSIIGGGLKAAGVELTMTGLGAFLDQLPPEVRNETLPKLIAGGDTAAATAPARERAGIQDSVRTMVSSLAGASPTQDPHAALFELANGYENIRASQPASSQRTVAMSETVARMRAAGEKLANPGAVIEKLFQNNTDGSRIAMLALIRNDPDPRYLDMVLRVVSDARSPFEQFQALKALEEMRPKLDENARAVARTAVQSVWDANGQGVKDDFSRKSLALRMLAR